MTCKQIESRLSAYVDQELSRSESSLIRAHLHECEACAEVANALARVKDLLSAQPEIEAPFGFEDRLVRAVFDQPVVAVRRFRLAWAGSAAFVFAFVGAWMYLQAVDARGVDLQNQTASTDFNLARDQAYAASGDPFAGNTVILTSTHGAR